MSVGIDTWAVDFVLLDKDDQRIGNAVAYRDDRTKGMDEEVYRTVPELSLIHIWVYEYGEYHDHEYSETKAGIWYITGRGYDN